MISYLFKYRENVLDVEDDRKWVEAITGILTYMEASWFFLYCLHVLNLIPILFCFLQPHTSISHLFSWRSFLFSLRVVPIFQQEFPFLLLLISLLSFFLAISFVSLNKKQIC